jgi:hypothetical protein
VGQPLCEDSRVEIPTQAKGGLEWGTRAWGTPRFDMR